MSAHDAFRSFAGHLVTAVSVIVTMVDGEPVATTAGSIVAASWEPPLLAVFSHTESRMETALSRSERFTVSILSDADQAVARRFARSGRGQGWSAFAGVRLRRRDPWPPVLTQAIAWADCATVQAITTGDHRCIVGEVKEADRIITASPLSYYRGHFHRLELALLPGSEAAARAADFTTSW